MMEDAPDFVPRNQSYLSWFLTSLGPETLGLLFAAMVVSLVLILLVAVRGRGPTVPAAIMLLIPLPLVVGGIAFVGSLVVALRNIEEQRGSLAIGRPLSHAVTSGLASTCFFLPVLVLGVVTMLCIVFKKPLPPGK